MTGTYTMRIERGATYRRTFTFKIGDAAESATERDLTGLTIVLRVVRPAAAGGVVEYTEDDALTIDPEVGEVTVEFTDEETAAFDWYRATYKFVSTDAFGAVDYMLEGAIRVR